LPELRLGFGGIPYIRFTANSRRIQENAYLQIPTSLELRIVARRHLEERLANEEVAMIPSL